MRPLFSKFKAISKVSENALGFSNYLSRRNKLSFQVDVKWKRPEKSLVYHPDNSGDLEPLPKLDTNEVYGLFKKSKEIENADPKVKNVLSLMYQTPINRLRHYRSEFVERVKNHPYDYTSAEVQIAWLTGTLRFLKLQIEEAKNRTARIPLIKKYSDYLSKRQKFLELLREQDYKKFEWILDQLNIIYRPTVPSEEQEKTRKKSLMKLVQLQQEKKKEENLAKLKKALDEKKIPFLEKKIQKLKWIKETEEKNNFLKTVSEADIEACMKTLEKVKLEVAKNSETGYQRRIHPYTFEPYFDKLLKEREKAGELIREGNVKSDSLFS